MRPLLTNTVYLKRIVFPLALAPAFYLAFSDLGANPIEHLLHVTGDWALRFLVITLAITPVSRLSGWRSIAATRRMLGLFCFFYALLHFGTYLVLDQGLEWRSISADILERPYITLGFGVFVTLSLLAATSTNRWMRRLGRKWKSLHRMVYPAALGATLHFLWLVKADSREPLVYLVVVLVLLLLRLPVFMPRTGRSRPRTLPTDAIG